MLALTSASRSILLLTAISSTIAYRPNPYADFAQHEPSIANVSALEVDLGYSTYSGYTDNALDTWLGIRFAAPPLARLRWQAPQPPKRTSKTPIPANQFGPLCPQAVDSSSNYVSVDNSPANEDCLFLNVFAPVERKILLPVFVWIHGGGYGQGDGQFYVEPLINTNNGSFVAVTIQYLLGAFGFLSSDEVYKRGVVNAGLLDQHMALHWVQQYIHLFGGDKSRVTIAGESAGAGSVMLLDMADGGTVGTKLFINSIAASPYLPPQFDYNSYQSTQSYYALATAVGCGPSYPYGHIGSRSIFDCLVDVDTTTLISANANISQAASFGTWAFRPVTDGILLQDLPSRQLSLGKVNGLHGLVGNNAEEGPYFVPTGIDTEDDLVSYLRQTFLTLSNREILQVLAQYPASSSPVDPNLPLFATEGDYGPTAVNQSISATGQQQRAIIIYGEATFVCPSYWLAEAYNNKSRHETGYKYQFSVPPALHAYEVGAYESPPQSGPYPPDLAIAFQQIFGNFIGKSNPSISNVVANGLSTGNKSQNPISAWPPYNASAPYQIDLNTTCGTIDGSGVCNGINQFRLVKADSWEGGRGARCDFWRSIVAKIAE